MPYVPVDLIDKQTVINKALLGHIQDGVVEAHKTADAINIQDVNAFKIETVTTIILKKKDGDEIFYIHDGEQGPEGPEGPQGPTGKGFSISKIYNSVESMNAGYATDGVELNGFVLIDTGNVEDEDNAKLYVKTDKGYSYLTDLSGSQGIQGPQGPEGPQGPTGVGILDVVFRDSYTDDDGKVINRYQLVFTNGMTFEFELKNGKDGAQGPEGPQGPTGNGVSYLSWNENETTTDAEGRKIRKYYLTFTDGTYQTFLVTDGKDGKTPVKGTDYFTDADKQAFVNSIPAAGSSLGLIKTGGGLTIVDGVANVNDDSHKHSDYAKISQVDEELKNKADQTDVDQLYETVSLNLDAAKKYADEVAAGIVGSAPETLNALNELAAALGNDPNFATTVANQIGKKANQVDVDKAIADLEQQTYEADESHNKSISDLNNYVEMLDSITSEHEERIREFELKGIKVIETASSMDDVLSQDPDSALHYYYMYIGETTENYTRGAVYKVKAV